MSFKSTFPVGMSMCCHMRTCLQFRAAGGIPDNGCCVNLVVSSLRARLLVHVLALTLCLAAVFVLLLLEVTNLFVLHCMHSPMEQWPLYFMAALAGRTFRVS